jgi:DNA-binding PadR family transcriptional regulator
MVLDMSKKESYDEIVFKELGSLQEKVLFFLAENPDNHKQTIQQGIQYPAEQYCSVKKAVDKLEKLGYIESKEATSQKKVQIKTYSCTELGVFYALIKNSSANIPEVLSAYKNRVEFCKSLQPLYDVWGHDQFALFLKDIGEFLPMIQKSGVEQAVPYMLLKMAKQMQSLDPKTRKKNVKEAMKQYPQYEKMLKEMREKINDLLT